MITTSAPSTTQMAKKFIAARQHDHEAPDDHERGRAAQPLIHPEHPWERG